MSASTNSSEAISASTEKASLLINKEKAVGAVQGKVLSLRGARSEYGIAKSTIHKIEDPAKTAHQAGRNRVCLSLLRLVLHLNSTFQPCVSFCICISSCVLLLPPLSHYCRCEWVHFAASVLHDASNYSSTLDIPKHHSLRPQRR